MTDEFDGMGFGALREHDRATAWQWDAANHADIGAGYYPPERNPVQRIIRAPPNAERVYQSLLHLLQSHGLPLPQDPERLREVTYRILSKPNDRELWVTALFINWFPNEFTDSHFRWEIERLLY